MKVKLKIGWANAYPELTPGNVYRVLSIEYDKLRVVSDAGEPLLFSKRAFAYVDSSIPSGWLVVRDEDGNVHAAPLAFSPRGFFERWFDREPRTIAQYISYMHEMMLSERKRDQFRTTLIKVVPKFDPDVTIYSELDEDQCEVRKVVISANGAMSYVDGKGNGGNADLRLLDRPQYCDPRDSQFEVVDCDSDAFERIWMEAL